VRGAQITTLGSPPEIVDLDDIEGVRIEAVALNPLDITVGSGRFYGGHPPLPYVPGCEAVGRSEHGALVYLFGDGRGVTKDGFLTDHVDVPAELLLPLPDGTDPALGAAAGVAGVAAWVPVAWKAKVGPGDRVLVLGATGAVGRIAIQAAELLGATMVVGASRSGGAGTVPLDRLEGVFGADGFTVCIDPIWGEPLARALAHAARHARIVHLGQAAGAEAPLRSADIRGKELQVLGHSNFALTVEERNRAYLEVLDHLRSGRISLPLERYPLERAAEAWERQRAGPGGKVVVEL
jgi:NADPH2:quinone reductase